MVRTVLSRYRPANQQSTRQHRALRILLAEHNERLRRLIGFVLRSDGHDVALAADGSELLEAIATLIIEGDRDRLQNHRQDRQDCEEERSFDLIVAAQALPGIPGLSVLAGLRARGRQTPFILITDNGAVQAQARRLDALSLDIPLTVESIRQVVHQAEALFDGDRAALSAG